MDVISTLVWVPAILSAAGRPRWDLEDATSNLPIVFSIIYVKEKCIQRLQQPRVPLLCSWGVRVFIILLFASAQVPQDFFGFEQQMPMCRTAI